MGTKNVHYILNFSFSDESNHEVSEAIARGVRATSAFKEANPVLLERKYSVITCDIFHEYLITVMLSCNMMYSYNHN